MKLISIDIETTGLNPAYCSVLEFGAVIFDPQPDLAVDGRVNEAGRRPHAFERLIAHPTRIQGEPYALRMNRGILDEIAGEKKTHIPIVAADDFIRDLHEFMMEHIAVDGNTMGGDPCAPYNPMTVAGKNYDAFDKQFLIRMPGWNEHIQPLLERRTLDVGSMYFEPKDDRIPSLDECLTHVGCPGSVTHRALDDAFAVMTAITRFFN